MVVPFSPLEEQFIRSTLLTKTDEEIAGLLDRAVEDVQAYINQVTNGAASDRLADVQKLKEEQRAQKEKKTQKIVRQTYLHDKKTREEVRKQERKRQLDMEEKRSAERRRSRESQVLKSKARDWRQYRTIRVDQKTAIVIHIDDDPVTAVQLYKQNMEKKSKLFKEEK